jgi:hypothetical protein
VALGWLEAKLLSCRPPGNQNHIIGGGGRFDACRGQIRIVSKIKIGSPAFELGEDELLHRVETDRSQTDGIGCRGSDKRFGKGFDQPEHLDEFPLAAIAHPGFQKPPQMLERFWKRPVLQRSGLIKGARLLLETWRRLDGRNQLPKIIRGVKFTDGCEVIAEPGDLQSQTAA